MNRNEFMSIMRASLGHLPKEDRDEILYDYDEHFRIGMENGKTEEEIAFSLGDPRILARQFSAGFMVNKADESKSVYNIIRAVFAVGVLGFFNLVFVLGPFLGLVGVLIALYAASIAVMVSGVGILIAVFAYPLLPEYINIGSNITAAIFLSIGVTCLGILMTIGCVYLTKLFYKATVAYLKMNAKIITK